MSRRASTLAASAGLLAAAIALIPIRSPACTVRIASGSAGPEGLMVVPVVLETQGRATGIQLDFAFDGSALDVATIAGESALVTRQNPRYAQIDPGTRRVLVIDTAGNPLPDGVLVNLFVRPRASAKAGTYPLSIKDAVCTDAGAHPIALTALSGTATVIGDEKPKVVLTAAGVLNAASLLPGPVSPGEVVTLVGSFLGSGVPRLTFGDAQAAILYRDSSQINAVVPDTLPVAGHTTVRLFLDDTEGSAFDIALSPAAPGVFTRDMSGKGYADAVNEDGSTNMPSTPASRGSMISAWITGVPRVGAGSTAVLVDGEQATLVDAVSVPGNPAVVQIRFVVPRNVRAGAAVDLSVRIGDSLSQAAVWVSIR